MLKSERYSQQRAFLFETYQQEFESIIVHESWYLLRELPADTVQKLLLSVLTKLLSTQNRNGTWKKNDSERITYDILRALQQSEIIDELLAHDKFKYDPRLWTIDNDSEYSLLAKLHIFHTIDAADDVHITQRVEQIKNSQNSNGSWENNLVATCYYLKRLLDFQVGSNDEAIKKGTEFLFSTYREEIDGWHITSPYGLKARSFFTENRVDEFDAAVRLRPEWIPRSVCFRHLAIQQHTECIRLMIDMGYEDDFRIVSALDEIYGLLNKYHGLCDTNIKKSFRQ